jgi:acyl carrier protein
LPASWVRRKVARAWSGNRGGHPHRPTRAAWASWSFAKLVVCKESSVEAKALDRTELGNQIIDVIVKEGMVDREKATMDATIESLDLKSIDVVMILTAIEEKFDVYIPMDGPFHEAKNIGDLVDAIAAHIGKDKS